MWISDNVLNGINGVAFVKEKDRQRLRDMNRKLFILPGRGKNLDGAVSGRNEENNRISDEEVRSARRNPGVAVKENEMILALAMLISDNCVTPKLNNMSFCERVPTIVFASLSVCCYWHNLKSDFIELKGTRSGSERQASLPWSPEGGSASIVVVNSSETDALQERLSEVCGLEGRPYPGQVIVVGTVRDITGVEVLDPGRSSCNPPRVHCICCTERGVPFAFGKIEPGLGEPRLRCNPVSGTSVDILDEGGNLQGEGMWGHIYVSEDSSGMDNVSRGKDEKNEKEYIPLEGRWMEDGSIEFRSKGNALTIEKRGVPGSPSSGMSGAQEVVGPFSHMASTVNRELTDRIRGIWGEVLPVTQVGPKDNFFALGGDLYKAIKIASKAEGLFETNDLYAFPSPELLARQIAEKHAKATQTCEGESSPDELEERIRTVWKAVLKIDTIDPDWNFFELGGTSFKALQVVSKLEGLASLTDLYETLTIRGLVERVRRGKTEPEQGRFLRRIVKTPGVAETSLICIPYGGGSSIVYEPLGRKIEDVKKSIDVLALQPPGHDPARMDEAVEPFETVSRCCTEEIQTRVDGEIVLYGHCVGAVLALDIARTLHRLGRRIKALIVGGFLPIGSNFMSRTVEAGWDLVSERMIVHFLRSLGAFQDDPGPREREHLVKCFRSDAKESLRAFRALYTAGGEPLLFPLYCLVGTQDPITKGYRKKYKMWERFCRDVYLKTIEDADHYFINSHTDEVTELIVDILEG